MTAHASINNDYKKKKICKPVRIHQLHLCKEIRPPLNEYPEYDTKPST